MIVTLTAHPSFDRTLVLPGPLHVGSVHRVVTSPGQAAGKGVNISRAAALHGVPSIAVVPVDDRDPYVRELRDAGVTCHTVAPDGEVRVNLTVTSPDGTTTKLNSLGPQMSPRLRSELTSVLRSMSHASWIVLAGSLPPGCPPGWYADLVALLADASARTAVDTSDAALRAITRGPCLPDLLKPNDEELASLTGIDAGELVADPRTAAAAAATLLARGAGAVLATLGAAGAVLVTRAGAWHALPPPTTVVSTVGAGDCSLYGYLAADLLDLAPAQRLAEAVAYGSAAAALSGTTIPTRDQVRPDLVVVRELGALPTVPHHPSEES